MSKETSPQPTESNPQSQISDAEEPALGWTAYAEKINGRFAMVGFVALLLIEIITDQSFLSWLGLQ